MASFKFVTRLCNDIGHVANASIAIRAIGRLPDLNGDRIFRQNPPCAKSKEGSDD